MRAPSELGVQYPTINIVVLGSSIWFDTWCLMRPASSMPDEEMTMHGSWLRLRALESLRSVI